MLCKWKERRIPWDADYRLYFELYCNVFWSFLDWRSICIQGSRYHRPEVALTDDLRSRSPGVSRSSLCRTTSMPKQQLHKHSKQYGQGNVVGSEVGFTVGVSEREVSNVIRTQASKIPVSAERYHQKWMELFINRCERVG